MESPEEGRQTVKKCKDGYQKRERRQIIEK